MKCTLKAVSKPRILAMLLYLQAFVIMGFFTLHRIPRLVARVGTEIHSTIATTTEVAAILIAAILFMTARSIRLRRRQAWALAIILQISLICVSLERTIHYLFFYKNPTVAISTYGLSHLISEIVILSLLILWRDKFRTIAGPQTMSRVVSFALKSFSTSLAISFLFIYFDHRLFITAPSITEALRLIFKGFIGVSDSLSYSTSRVQERVELLLGGLGIINALAISVKLFKPFEKKTELNPDDEHGLRALLSQNSDSDSLAYFVLRDNKSIMWSRNKKAAIAYTVVNGVMITTGDPVGDRESWPDAIARFIEEAELHAWIPCVYGCSEIAGEIWVRETQFTALEIGDEAIVLTKDFTLEGSAMKNVRQMIARVNRAGITTITKQVKEMTSIEREGLAHFAQKWRRGGDERGFSMALGRFCDVRDPDLVLTWGELNGEPIALLQFVPWGNNGLSLDIMRRSEKAEGGINETLIAATIEWGRTRGIEKLSLNFATFRSIFERGSRLGAGPIVRMSYRVLKYLSRFAQMETLYRFNAKFRPEWEPRFIIYPGASNLLPVTIAILTIESFWPPLKLNKR